MKNHHTETAAQHVTAAVARARPEELAATVRSRLGEHELEDTEYLCVVDLEDRLVGLLSFADLFRLPRDTPVAQAMRDAPPAVLAYEDQEKVASIALHFGLNSIPVVDAGQRLLGVVPAKALLKILRHEHVEDIHRLAGIQRETSHARRAMDAPPLRRARDRLPWLLIGLVGSMLATLVMSRFEAALTSRVTLAYFIPGLVYLADAIGTQTEAITVRGLSLSHLRIGHLLGGEMRTGLLIGFALAGLTFPIVWLAFQDIRLAVAVSGALLAAGVLASAVGLLLPWLLSNMNLDPAFGSGPVATVIQDVLTLLTYFAIVSLLF